MPQGCQFTDPALMVVGPWPWADSSSGAVLELIPREGKWLSNSLLTVDVRESVGFLLCTRKLVQAGLARHERLSLELRGSAEEGGAGSVLLQECPDCC